MKTERCTGGTCGTTKAELAYAPASQGTPTLASRHQKLGRRFDFFESTWHSVLTFFIYFFSYASLCFPHMYSSLGPAWLLRAGIFLLILSPCFWWWPPVLPVNSSSVQSWRAWLHELSTAQGSLAKSGHFLKILMKVLHGPVLAGLFSSWSQRSSAFSVPSAFKVSNGCCGLCPLPRGPPFLSLPLPFPGTPSSARPSRAFRMHFCGTSFYGSWWAAQAQLSVASKTICYWSFFSPHSISLQEPQVVASPQLRIQEIHSSR